jgi:hypothetical protein
MAKDTYLTLRASSLVARDWQTPAQKALEHSLVFDQGMTQLMLFMRTVRNRSEKTNWKNVVVVSGSAVLSSRSRWEERRRNGGMKRSARC